VTDKHLVFSKTGKGLLEVKSKGHRLPKDQMRLLYLVDGKATLSELAAQSRIAESEAHKALTLLCDAGYIKELISSRDEPAAAAEPSGEDDLDFTRVLAEPAPAKPPAPDPVAAQQRERDEAQQRAQEQRQGAAEETRAQQERERLAQQERERLAQQGQQRIRDERRAQQERDRRQQEKLQPRTEPQRPAKATTPESMTRPPVSDPLADLDAELQAQKRIYDQPSIPLKPEQSGAHAAAPEPQRPAPVKLPPYAPADEELLDPLPPPDDSKAAFERARQDAAQRAREEAIRLQQEAKERRARAQRKP
jgi:hypothetical protein